MFRINFLWGISLTVFNSHHSTFKAKKRIKLTYSSAKVLRVLNEKTRSSRSGFEKKSSLRHKWHEVFLPKTLFFLNPTF